MAFGVSHELEYFPTFKDPSVEPLRRLFQAQRENDAVAEVVLREFTKRAIQEKVDAEHWEGVLPNIVDPEFRHAADQFDEMTRDAIRDAASKHRYPPEFMRSMGQRRFRNPETNNQVRFVSLPPAEQRKLYRAWQSRFRKKTPEQQLAPGIAEGLRTHQRGLVMGLHQRGSLDLKQMQKLVGGDKKSLMHSLGSLEMSGVTQQTEDERGQPYWELTDLGKEVGRHLGREYGQASPLTPPKREEPGAPEPTPSLDYPGPDIGREIGEAKTGSEDRGEGSGEGSEFLGPGDSGKISGLGTDNALASVDPQTQQQYRAFLHAMEGQTFRHPDTGNRVKFVSLPAAEQRRLHHQWVHNQQSQRVSMDISNWNFTKDAATPEQFRGKRFRHPETGNMVLFESLPPKEQGVLIRWEAQRNPPQRRWPPPGVDEKLRTRKFKHPETGEQVPFDDLPRSEQDVARRWEIQRDPPAEQDPLKDDPDPREQHLIEMAEARGDTSGMGHDDTRQRWSLDEEWFDDLPEETGDVLANSSDDFKREVSHRKFRHPGTGNQVLFQSLPPEAQKTVYEQWQGHRGPEGPPPAAPAPAAPQPGPGGAPGGMDIGQFMELLKSQPRGFHELSPQRQREVQEGGPGQTQEEFEAVPEQVAGLEEEWGFEEEREAAYSDDFKREVSQQKFRHPETGNQVRFVSLPSREQQKVYRQWSGRRQQQPSEQQTQRFTWPARGRPPGGGPPQRGRRPGEGRPQAPKPLSGVDKDHPLNRARGVVRQHAQEFLDEVSDDENFHELPLPEQVQAFSEWSLKKNPPPPEMARELRRRDEEALAPIREKDFKRRLKKFEEGQRGMGKVHEHPDTGEPAGYDDLPRNIQRQMFMQEQHERDASMSMDHWGFVEADNKEARMEDYAFMHGPFAPQGLTPGIKMPGNPHGMSGEPPPEPPPPAEIKRMLADNMRDMGRSLMISGMKPARPQMMAIAKALDGLLDQLDALADQPGRKALQRRILLNIRPRIMSPGR